MCLFRIFSWKHHPSGHDALHFCSGAQGADGTPIQYKSDSLHSIYYGGSILHSTFICHGAENKPEELPFREGAWFGKVGGGGSTYQTVRG